jgi:hypothetical protein
MKKLTTLLMAVSALSFAQGKTTAADVKQKAGETVDTTKRYANEKKEDFEARIDAQLSTLSADVTSLKDRAKNSADATVKDLEARQKKADDKAAELKKAGGNAWSSLKSGVENAVDDLQKGVEKAKAK